MPYIIALYILLMQSVVLAFVPEGVENFGIINGGRPTQTIGATLFYDRPRYKVDYETLEIIAGTPLGANYLSLGASMSVGNKFTDRDSYFARYDWTYLSTQSVAFKWAHQDLRYTTAAKEQVGVEFTGFVGFGAGGGGASSSGFYYSFGMYQRWLKQRWNSDVFSPWSYATDDVDRYVVMLLGVKKAFDQREFLTFDVNVRDAHVYYRLDNIGFDASWYMGASQASMFKLLAGIRTTGIFVGSGVWTEVHFGAGFVGF